MIASEVISMVRTLFSDSAGIQITDGEIITFINSALKDLAYDANINQSVAVANIRAGQYEYVLPEDILTMINVKYNGQVLQALSIQEADTFIQGNANPQVIATEGVPTQYWIFARTIHLFPTPSADLDSGLRAYYTRLPTTIVQVTDIIDIPAQYHNILIDKVMQWAHEKDENWTASQIKESQYNASVKAKTDDESWNEHETYPNIGTSTRDSDNGDSLYTGAYWY